MQSSGVQGGERLQVTADLTECRTQLKAWVMGDQRGGHKASSCFMQMLKDGDECRYRLDSNVAKDILECGNSMNINVKNGYKCWYGLDGWI